MNTFTVRDLREHTGELIQGAEEGHLALVTKHGKPIFIALPFDENLVEHGLHVAIAIDIFREGTVSLAKAAKVAKLPLEEFIEKLAALNIPIVDYSEEALLQEVNMIKKFKRD